MFRASYPGISILRGAVAVGVVFLAGACASGEPTGLNQAELNKEAVFQRQMALEEAVASRRRIEDVSFRLMTAAADFCGDRQAAAYGFTVANRPIQ